MTTGPNQLVVYDMSDYKRLVEFVRHNGRPRRARGLATRDVGFTTITVLHPEYGGMPLGVGRSLNPAIGAIEALQLIAGVPRADLVLRVAPQFKRFMDPLGNGAQYFHGAYGARIGSQLIDVAEKFIRDPDTRQAVITLWDPYRDVMPDKHDYPCTVAMVFTLVDRDVLEMDVFMRSNDVWLGLPYDVFQFTQLQATLANALSATTGTYRHTAVSLHIYETDIDKIDELIPSRDRTYRDIFQPAGIGWPGMDVQTLMNRARDIMDNRPDFNFDGITQSELWYHQRIHGVKSDDTATIVG